tara:strand:- start:5028 stop:5615 length:588 start_codon:yes stop_codon:yes gene_type:complete
MIKKLAKYLPENAVEYVDEIIKEHPLEIKIVNERSSKHGDFKRTLNRKFIITLNNNLNQYQFLLTLIHEIAHFVTFKQNGSVKPHGLEWKRNFQHLMLPFINPSIYPENLLPLLANYLKNPKASTGSDVTLTYALKQFDEDSEKSFIFEIAFGSLFVFRNKTYKKGNLRRTRFECIEISSKRTYLFNRNAEIETL